MAILGALTWLTASGLYAVVDELRTGHKIRSHKLSGSLIATMDYAVNDTRFEGIIRRFENDWELDGGTLYPEKLIGFFAENPAARKQWVRMQASILLHDSMQRRSCERDIKQFGDESMQYAIDYGRAESQYIFEHDPDAERAFLNELAEQKARDDRINRIDKIKTVIKRSLLFSGFGLMILSIILVKTGLNTPFVWVLCAAGATMSLTSIAIYAIEYMTF